MIIGNGDIASAIVDDDRYIFFASGVSNSKCTDENQFKRERIYISNINRNKHVFYFSTLAIFYDNNPYVEHKKEMESIIRNGFERHTIIRLGNITWGENPKIMVPYFKLCLKTKVEPEIQNVIRHMVTLEDFEYWLEKLKEKPINTAMITGRLLSVSNVWEMVKDGTF